MLCFTLSSPFHLLKDVWQDVSVSEIQIDDINQDFLLSEVFYRFSLVTVCQKGVKKKKNCQASGHIFLI